MHIKFFLEEPSAEEALRYILPRIFADDVSYEFHISEGKEDLLNNLSTLLKGHQWIPDNWRIIVLIDEDREDCRKLKRKLETAAHEAGFVTKSRAAQNIAQHMEPDRNRSRSFQVFVEGLKACVGEKWLV